MVVENGFLSSRAEEESVGGHPRKFDGQSGFVRGLCAASLALFPMSTRLLYPQLVQACATLPFTCRFCVLSSSHLVLTIHIPWPSPYQKRHFSRFVCFADNICNCSTRKISLGPLQTLSAPHKPKNGYTRISSKQTMLLTFCLRKDIVCVS